MARDGSGFVHRFVYGEEPRDHRTLLLLHGMGGDETELLQMGRLLSPGSALLSPRGKVEENGLRRFFRRLAKGVFDEEDLRRRAGELAAFVQAAATWYGFDSKQVLAAGYSNGANMAAALLLLRPEILTGAVLLRPMVPLAPKELPDLSGKRIFIAGGTRDPITPPEHSERLRKLLAACGAEVTLTWAEGGHGLGEDEIERARQWLLPVRRSPARPALGEEAVAVL
jgi:predicted esterase